MRIVHVASYYGGDGAALAAARLHEGQLRLGHDSVMFVSAVRGEVQAPAVTVFAPPGDVLSRLRRRLRRRQIARDRARGRAPRPGEDEAFSDDRSPHGADVPAQLPSGDVVHVHAMLDFVDYRAFFRAVPRHAPVVRTLHDMSFFTGGCHYDAGCGRYAGRCGLCPQLGSRAEDDLSREIWRRKRAALDAVPPGRLHLVTPSRWLAAEAGRSALLRGLPVTVIPHGLDTETFRPREPSAAREALGIPGEARVVLFVAQPVTRRLKGFALLAQALRECSHLPGLTLVSVGNGAPPAEVPVPHRRLGPIHHPGVLSLVYSAADVLAVPSLQEAFGQVAVEAMACATPVVAFAVGGLLDIVRPWVTGVLVPPGDAVALGAALRALLQEPERRREMGARGRTVAVEEYRLDLPPQRYAALYARMLAWQQPSGRAARTPSGPGNAPRGGLVGG
jgi:glycosyltransferase involved in cell wall biosynthesis